MLAVARAAGETAPLLFTALFSNYWISRLSPSSCRRRSAILMKPTASLAVLIYNFSSIAVRQPDRAGLGRRAGAGRCSCSPSTLPARASAGRSR